MYKANRWSKSRYPFLRYCYFVLSILGMLPLIIAYPILLMIVKFVSIFHHGTEWKKLDSFMTLFEGQIEGYLQVTLQVILCQSDSLFHQLIQNVTTKFTGIYHNISCWVYTCFVLNLDRSIFGVFIFKLNVKKIPKTKQLLNIFYSSKCQRNSTFWLIDRIMNHFDKL